MYPFFRSLLFRLDPETSHQLTLRALRMAGNFPLSNWLLRQIYKVPAKPVQAFGLTFRNPVGLAAGRYDGKDGQKIIPRYAVLQPLDEPAQTPDSLPQSPGDAVSRAEVLRAFANFCLHCRALIADDQAGAFERARNQFLNAVR